ncbi:Alpha/Beta hydrolase protein [Plectosphaerella plurivora]|uniref:Alpha/Beta hydrolase protein n=1 Tax=Plectosphaerella plurivora TaxID=936078 RepID=A0A9P9AAI1_9PEZI|nr:Alpha/Beta hydrolase protein [Plectosphaerella plurivora]
MAPSTCEIIQAPEHASPNTLPLILIHDGGGTTFGYHCLDPLRRAIYGISNPHFESNGPWPGGIDEMAHLYANMVRATVSSPDFPRSSSRAKVLLGGWSFGGMLSLHMAYLLRDDPAVEVVGLLLIDTPRPVQSQKWTGAAVPIPSVGAEGKPLRKNEILALQAMGAARDMIQSWTMPDWTLSGARLPPAVLVRAKAAVPETEPGTAASVDKSRSDPKLGWGEWEGHDLVREVIDVEGHHYDIFTFARVSATSTGIKKACAVLESFQTAA